MPALRSLQLIPLCISLCSLIRFGISRSAVILCGPEEDWSEVDREIVLRLYGVDPKPDPTLAKEIVSKIIRDKREQGEEVEQELIGLLDQLERRTAEASRQGQ